MKKIEFGCNFCDALARAKAIMERISRGSVIVWENYCPIRRCESLDVDYTTEDGSRSFMNSFDGHADSSFVSTNIPIVVFELIWIKQDFNGKPLGAIEFRFHLAGKMHTDFPLDPNWNWFSEILKVTYVFESLGKSPSVQKKIVFGGGVEVEDLSLVPAELNCEIFGSVGNYMRFFESDDLISGIEKTWKL